jgi:hypothetical protein
MQSWLPENIDRVATGVVIDANPVVCRGTPTASAAIVRLTVCRAKIIGNWQKPFSRAVKTCAAVMQDEEHTHHA